MKSITFNGIKGQVIESSPHGNYLVVELTDEITICGTFSNQWNWVINPEIQSGFKSFITYYGVMKPDSEIEELINSKGGNIDSIREARRNTAYPFEYKIRNLSPNSVKELI